MSTPEHGPDEKAIRDLLAQLGESLTDDSGDSQSIPVEVGDRIMGALAELPPLTPGTDKDDTVVPMRRSRRRVGGWLVAAAMVVVVGGGGWALAHRSDSHGSADVASADASSAGGSASSSQDGLAQGGRIALPSVSVADFHDDVEALLGDDVGRAYGQMLDNLSADSPTAGQARSPAPNEAHKDLQGYSAASPELAGGRPDCARPSGTTGRQVEVTIDGRLGQLIVTPSKGKRVVTAYDCTGHQLLATTTLP
jgi:hypothetical protein